MAHELQSVLYVVFEIDWRREYWAISARKGGSADNPFQIGKLEFCQFLPEKLVFCVHSQLELLRVYTPAMNPHPYDGEDIWSFTSQDPDTGLGAPDLRLSSSMGFFYSSMGDQTGMAPLEADMRASSSIMNSSAEFIKTEHISTSNMDQLNPQTVAYENFGALPPPSKKKRRRERDQVMEATIQYGNGDGPQITTPSTPSVMNAYRGGPEHAYPSNEEDFFFVESMPEQQLTPVLPFNHILPYVAEYTNIRDSVVILRAQQYHILKTERARIPELKETIRTLSARLQAVEDEFQRLRCAALLHTADVNRIFWLQPEIHTCRVQLELYMNEINHILSPNEAWKCTELVLEEHPFPISLKQKENVPRVVVRLLTGATTTIAQVSAVEARVVSMSQGSPKPPEIINFTEKMKMAPYHRETPDANGPTDFGYIATFEQLNFLTGTRMRDFALQFVCKVNLGAGKSEVAETDPTPPFVVFTNGNQWNDIEGILLRWEAFGGSANAIWCRLANALQRRYMLATLQNPDEPQRPLSRTDFTFLYQTKIDPKGGMFKAFKFGKTTITLSTPI